jgi:membrane protease YdiL (CAAX protease family)
MAKASKPPSDFPFYAGAPVGISPRGWLCLMVSVGVAFAMLVAMPFTSLPASLLPATLFAGIPLATLAALTGRSWTALFRRVGLREIGIMLLTVIAAMLASGSMALVIGVSTNTTANPAITAMTSMSIGDYIRRLIPTAPQLLGEELLTILPFLAILWYATQRLGVGKKVAIFTALVGSTLLFAAAHLPTYNWQYAQCFGVIGAARVVLTLSYIWTRNLWVSAGAHILNDWTEFTFVFGFGHVPISTH